MLIGCEAFRKQTSIFFVTEIITNQIVFFTGEKKTENINLLLKRENLTHVCMKKRKQKKGKTTTEHRVFCEGEGIVNL